MRVSLTGLGVALILLAVGLLMIVIVLPVTSIGEGNPTLMNLLGVLVCNPGEQFVQDFHTQSDLRGTVRGGSVYCVNNENQRTEVTDNLVGRALLIFFIPFLIGLTMTIVGSSRQTSRRFQTGVAAVQAFNATPPGVGSGTSVEFKEGILKVNGKEIPFGQMLSAKQMSRLQQIRPIVLHSLSNSTTLAEKLRQLQEAKDASLISDEEYERLQKHVMDEVL